VRIDGICEAAGREAGVAERGTGGAKLNVTIGGESRSNVIDPEEGVGERQRDGGRDVVAAIAGISGARNDGGTGRCGDGVTAVINRKLKESLSEPPV